MHARLDHGAVLLLTRTGLDWTHKYPAIAEAVASIGAEQAYLDGELCGVRPDGITSFSIIQLASDSGNATALVFFLIDLLHLGGGDFCPRPLGERKDRLAGVAGECAFTGGLRRDRREFRPNATQQPNARRQRVAIPAAASAPPALNGCGNACSRSRPARCRLISRRQAV